MRRVVILLLSLVFASPSLARTITVDDNGPADFAGIQAAIDDANYGDTVEVAEGVYVENITLKNGVILIGEVIGGEPNNTVIDGNSNGSVVTSIDCDANTVLDGFKITNGNGMLVDDSPYDGGGGMYCYHSSPIVTGCIFSGNLADYGGGMLNSQSNPTVTNCTFTGNLADYGGGMCNIPPILTTISNCILWGNTASVGNEICNISPWIAFPPSTPISYCDIEGCFSGGTWDVYWCDDYGGNIDVDPCFAAPGYWQDPCGTPSDHNDDVWVDGDYHLKSQAGRWDANAQVWVTDAVTSPCIDAGDPCSDWTAELWPHGKRINMGAYGGTEQASMSTSTVGNIADLNNDGIINFLDYANVAGMWDVNEVLLREDLDRNGSVDGVDMGMFVEQWLWQTPPAPPDGMVLVYINDPGVEGTSTPFKGQMSKYETTNAQYCQFLNAALASGDIFVDSDNIVYGADGSNSGADFVGEIYFATTNAPSGYPHNGEYSQIDYNNVSGTFSVRIRDSNDMSNHPVVMVTWYGATAFCNFYGYRLPTEVEWQAVADYDGSYTYGCGTTIDHNKANYCDYDYGGYANPLGLYSEPYTSPVDHYPSYGYGINDMAGNVWEWTSGCWYSDCRGDYRVIRGGSWYGSDDHCWVSYRFHNWSLPDVSSHLIGFRVCR